MGKSVPNPEFVELATRHYATAGFARRRKGQRYMPHILPLFLFQEDLGGYSLELLGVGHMYTPHGQVVPCDHLLVTTPAGVRVPAYRRSSPGNNYAICQELNYVVA